MKNKVLVDTSVWVEFFRHRSEPGRLVEDLLMGHAVWTCGMVMFEILKGIRLEEEKTRVLQLLEILPYVEMTKALWLRASELSTDLRREGVTLPNSDLFIAAIALGHNLSVFTLDHHFKQIPSLKLYEPLSWT